MFELLKYGGAIALGYALGKALRRRPPQWVFAFVVALLVFLVAANASPIISVNLGGFVAVSLLYALALVFASALLGSLIDRTSGGETAQRPVISLYALSALIAGLITGHFVRLNYSVAFDPLLLFLLLVAGADMAWVPLRLEKSMLASPAISLASAAAVAPIFTLFFGITPAVAFGLGWYSFAGPYLAGAGDAVGGAYGLLVNFLREQLTFTLAPVLAKRFGKAGILAMGGATTMDTTLPLYTALYGSAFSLYAFTNGVLLTLIVPILLPLVHQLYTSII